MTYAIKFFNLLFRSTGVENSNQILNTYIILIARPFSLQRIRNKTEIDQIHNKPDNPVIDTKSIDPRSPEVNTYTDVHVTVNKDPTL